MGKFTNKYGYTLAIRACQVWLLIGFSFLSFSQEKNKEYYINELNETFEWISNTLSDYQFKRDTEEYKYSLFLIESKDSSKEYLIMGLYEEIIKGESKGEKVLMIPIRNITSAFVEIDSENDRKLNVVIRGLSGEGTFIIDEETITNNFTFHLNRTSSMISDIPERLMKAFKYLMETNISLIKLTNKF